MSIGYENISRIPQNTDSWRLITADWPDAPWREHRARRTPWRERLEARAGYWIVALALFMTMATSTIPTPLYALYQQRDHFSSLMVTIVFAVYAGGVIMSLFLVGHVSTGSGVVGFWRRGSSSTSRVHSSSSSRRASPDFWSRA